MRALLLVGLVFVSLGAIALGQLDARSKLKPITAPIRHAGVFHVATGRWTRGASLASAVGPDVLYNNTCAAVYSIGMGCCTQFSHRGRIPSPTSPLADSQFYGTTNSAHRYDSWPGCQSEHTIDGFRIGYCSSHVGTVGWEYLFASIYDACGGGDLVPQYTIQLPGLPGGGSSGAQHCWTIDIDVSGLPGGGFALSADGDGGYGGSDTFGWGMRLDPPLPTADFTGPLIAGDFTWTGGPGTVNVPLEPCTGTDGTIFDRPVIDLSQPGTGMSSPDYFRQTVCSGCTDTGPGCYYFLGNPHADFYLKLYATTSCGVAEGGMGKFCAPGVLGVVSCPCGNPAVPAGSTTGCDNFVAPAGGAELSGSGVAVADPGDTLALDMSGGVGTSVTVLFQGTAIANTRSGAGVRCVGGALKRLYKGDPVGGAISFPNNGVSVHDQSAAKGFVVQAPISLLYFCAYRDSAANGHTGCPGTAFGFNTSNAMWVLWSP